MRPVRNMEFAVGDSVVYRIMGPGVLKEEPRKMFGEEREYLTIKILHNDMTVMVPCDADLAGCVTSLTKRPRRRSLQSSPTTRRRCQRTGTAGSSTIATGSRRVIVSAR